MIHPCNNSYIFTQDVTIVQSAIRAHLYQKQYLQDHQSFESESIEDEYHEASKLENIPEDNGNTSTEEAIEVIQSTLRGHLTRQDILNKYISLVLCNKYS